jgi:hypothetical protein
MYDGIGVLLKRCRFSIRELPDMRERGFKAFTRCLIRAAVLTQRHNSRTISYEFVWNGGVTIPLAAKFHENAVKNGLWSNVDATVWTTLSVSPLNGGGHDSQNGRNISNGKGAVRATYDFKIAAHALSPLDIWFMAMLFSLDASRISCSIDMMISVSCSYEGTVLLA